MYNDEILESRMHAEEYFKEELIEVQSVEEAEIVIRQNSRFVLEDLVPCKGQKIFNPELKHS